MTYDELYRKAVEEESLKDLSFDIIRWEESGQSVLGEVVGFEDFEAGEYDMQCFQWKIKTDEGLVSCVLGSVADKRMENVVVGDLIYIEYQGKKELPNGRRVNLFKIQHLQK